MSASKVTPYHPQLLWKGAYYRDELGELLTKVKKGARISENGDEGTVDFNNACVVADDYVILNVQLNHDIALNSPIYPHLHWVQSSSAIRNWVLQYRWLRNGEVMPVAWEAIPLNHLIFNYTSGSIVQISSGQAIHPPIANDTNLSDIVQFRLARDTANVLGLYDAVDNTGTISAVMFDIHVLVNQGGSINEYEK